MGTRWVNTKQFKCKPRLSTALWLPPIKDLLNHNSVAAAAISRGAPLSLAVIHTHTHALTHLLYVHIGWHTFRVTFDNIITGDINRQLLITVYTLFVCTFTNYIHPSFLHCRLQCMCIWGPSKQATTRPCNLLDSAHHVPNHLSYYVPQPVLSSVQNQWLSWLYTAVSIDIRWPLLPLSFPLGSLLW